MTIVKRIVCLANSRKSSGRCIAGKELTEDGPGRWVRPVSDREHQEVSEDERQYPDGSDPRVLDIIDVPLLSSQPSSYQSENWRLDPSHYWRRTGRIAWKDLPALADDPEILWVNGPHTWNGRNDRVPQAEAELLSESLYLLHIDPVTLRVFAPGANFGDPKRRVQGGFTYHGAEYRLRVTDPVVERAYLARDDGEYRLDNCYITVSLGEPFEGFCYKLVAALMTASGKLA